MTDESQIMNYLFVEMTAELLADVRQSQILSRSVLLSIVTLLLHVGNIIDSQEKRSATITIE